MKKSISVLFFIALTLAACLSPSGGSGAAQVTVTSAPTECCAKVTLTLTLEPTVTTPPESPEPALPAEVQEKFDKAGINTSDLDIDQNGLHINIDGQEEVIVPNEDLINFEYSVNGVTQEVYQFIPVINPKTNNMVLYSFDTKMKTWFIKETLPLVKLSTDRNNPGKCTYMDVLSGNLARSIMEQSTIVFPEDAINMGWDFSSGATGSTAPIFLVEGSKNAMQLVNFCKMPADFLGLSGTIDVATVAVLNPDSSIGFLNFNIGNNRLKLRNIFFESISSGGFNTGIARHQQIGGVAELISLPLIITAQKEHDLMVATLQINDIIDDNISKFIFTPAKR